MAEQRDAGVDPRFDPVFQRGYDPQRHRTRLRAAAPTAEEPPPAAPPPPAEERPAAPDARRSPAEPAPDEPAPDEAADTSADPPARNPFRLILLLASIAAIGGSALLLWNRLSQDPYGSFNTTVVSRLFADQFREALMVPLLTAGLLGLCLWLALGALRRRPDETSSSDV